MTCILPELYSWNRETNVAQSLANTLKCTHVGMIGEHVAKNRNRLSIAETLAIRAEVLYHQPGLKDSLAELHSFPENIISNKNEMSALSESSLPQRLVVIIKYLECVIKNRFHNSRLPACITDIA